VHLTASSTVVVLWEQRASRNASSGIHLGWNFKEGSIYGAAVSGTTPAHTLLRSSLTGRRHSPAARSVPRRPSFGFALANLSAILAVSSIADAQVHRFGFYDPSLMKIVRWGLMLSLAGFLFAVGEAWRKSTLRWHAPVCTFGTFAFWILAAEGE
jgi:hypothetical protein